MKMYSNETYVSVFTVTLVGLVLFVSAPQTGAANLNTLRATVADNVNGFTIDESRTSSTGPVSYDSSPIIPIPTPILGTVPYPNRSRVAGEADFGVLKAKTMASAGNGFSSRQASTNVRTSYQVFVKTAAPGVGPVLNIGTPVSISLSLRLDGSLNSAAAVGDNTGHADFDADFRIVDPNHPTLCGEGCLPIFEFRAGAASTSHGSTGFTFNSWTWDLESRDTQGVMIDHQLDSNSWDLGPGSTCLPGPGNNFCLNDINFDTGILTTTFETTVGASLDILGSLNTFANVVNFGGDGGFGSVNFLDTFGLVLTPITPGVELDYGGITPAPFDLGNQTVPVPAAIWLFGSGLIGLIGVARRKKA